MAHSPSICFNWIVKTGTRPPQRADCVRHSVKQIAQIETAPVQWKVNIPTVKRTTCQCSGNKFTLSSVLLIVLLIWKEVLFNRRKPFFFVIVLDKRSTFSFYLHKWTIVFVSDTKRTRNTIRHRIIAIGWVRREWCLHKCIMVRQNTEKNNKLRLYVQD